MATDQDHTGGFDPEYFGAYARAEKKHFWFEARANLIARAVRRLAPKSKSFFDVGCGTGFILQSLRTEIPTMESHGCDAFVEALSHVRGRLGESAHLYRCEANALPFYREFDALGAFDVLEHIEDDKGALRNIIQAVKPGGFVFLTVPQHPWLWSNWDEFNYHVRRYKTGELEKLVSQNGLEIVYATSFMTLTLPLMLLRSWIDRVRTGDFEAGLEISKPVNWILRGVMVIESSLLKLGVRFPVGGSVFIVGRVPEVSESIEVVSDSGELQSGS